MWFSHELSLQSLPGHVWLTETPCSCMGHSSLRRCAMGGDCKALLMMCAQCVKARSSCRSSLACDIVNCSQLLQLAEFVHQLTCVLLPWTRRLIHRLNVVCRPEKRRLFLPMNSNKHARHCIHEIGTLAVKANSVFPVVLARVIIDSCQTMRTQKICTCCTE